MAGDDTRTLQHDPIRARAAAHSRRGPLDSRTAAATPYCARYCPAEPIIGFAFDPQAGIHAFGSDRRTAFRAKPNGFAYVPSGCDVYSKSESGGEYMRVVIKGPRRKLRSGGRPLQ